MAIPTLHDIRKARIKYLDENKGKRMTTREFKHLFGYHKTTSMQDILSWSAFKNRIKKVSQRGHEAIWEIS